jgi:uncharacterized metal-binding protein
MMIVVRNLWYPYQTVSTHRSLGWMVQKG